MAKTRIDVTLDEETLKRLDKFARKAKMNRSQALNALLDAALNEETVQVRTVSRTAKIYGEKAMENAKEVNQ